MRVVRRIGEKIFYDAGCSFARSLILFEDDRNAHAWLYVLSFPVWHKIALGFLKHSF